MISLMWMGSRTSQPQRRMLTKWQKCFTSVSSKLVSSAYFACRHTPHCDIFHLTQSPFLTLASYPCSRSWRLLQLWGVSTCKSNVFPTLSVKNTSKGLISQVVCHGPTMLESTENLLWPPQILNKHPELCLTSTNSLTDSLKDNPDRQDPQWAWGRQKHEGYLTRGTSSL